MTNQTTLTDRLSKFRRRRLSCTSPVFYSATQSYKNKLTNITFQNPKINHSIVWYCTNVTDVCSMEVSTYRPNTWRVLCPHSHGTNCETFRKQFCRNTSMKHSWILRCYCASSARFHQTTRRHIPEDGNLNCLKCLTNCI